MRLGPHVTLDWNQPPSNPVRLSHTQTNHHYHHYHHHHPLSNQVAGQSRPPAIFLTLTLASHSSVEFAVSRFSAVPSLRPDHPRGRLLRTNIPCHCPNPFFVGHILYNLQVQIEGHLILSRILRPLFPKRPSLNNHFANNFSRRTANSRFCYCGASHSSAFREPSEQPQHKGRERKRRRQRKKQENETKTKKSPRERARERGRRRVRTEDGARQNSK